MDVNINVYVLCIFMKFYKINRKLFWQIISFTLEKLETNPLLSVRAINFFGGFPKDSNKAKKFPTNRQIITLTNTYVFLGKSILALNETKCFYPNFELK